MYTPEYMSAQNEDFIISIPVLRYTRYLLHYDIVLIMRNNEN